MNGLKVPVITPPESDEIEVSLFGPGYGECAVLHIGEGEWIIVDSFRDPDTNEPVALKYLEQLGIDPCSAICCVIATHWDDDHIDGLADLIRASPNASFAISGAFSNVEFKSLLRGWLAFDSVFLGSGVNQLNEIIALKGTPILASENTVVYERHTGLQCEVRALSPSNDGIVATVTRLASFENPTHGKRLPRIEGNHSSVVISVEIAGRSILLGGDLEVRSSRLYGWRRVVDSHQKSGRAKHEVFKIPHHGSVNGDADEIWKGLLEKHPHSVVSPFVGGRVKLPGGQERHRIRGRTPNAFLTAPPAAKKFRHKNRTVEKTMWEAAKRIEAVPNRFGQVRLRSKISEPVGTWDVKLFGASEPV